MQTTFSLGCVLTPLALFGQLFAAVDAVDLATVEQLVAAGAEINETDSDMGWSVLHHAINIPDEQSRVHMCVLIRLALASPHPEQALCSLLSCRITKLLAMGASVDVVCAPQPT